MSASEKLKALGYPYPTQAHQRRLIAALPQIVTVVELMEGICEREFAMDADIEEGRPALAALEEALP